MIDCGSLEFAQARLQARHGQRATEADWQRLEVTREFGALLDVARHTPLQPWLVGLTRDSRSHQIEAVLRGHGRALVTELAGWMPARWQAAVAWCAVLPDLPLLQHLARGGAAPPWLGDDAAWRPLAGVAPGAAGEAAERTATAPAPVLPAAALTGTVYAPLAAAWPAPATLGAAWHAEWRRRLPRPLRPPEAGEDSLRQLVQTLRAHAGAFAAAPPAQAGLLRRALQARLTLLLRRSALEPAAAFTHLALSALDLERLRGELLRRALFAPRGAA